MPPRTEVPWDATVAEHLAAAAGVDAPDSAPTWIGRVIDERYRIVELLGEGGMGAVFVAEHLKLRKQVALKTIRLEFASNAEAEARFAREALATAQLDHPHVASAIDFGHLPEGGAYLVIQLVRGVSLARHLDSHGKIGWGTVADLGSQIADALSAAHAAGIVHRDLKPDNILIESRDDGRLLAKVVDFGIARLAEEVPTAHSKSTLPLTRMGAILGTPGYMPPEQAVGDTVDARGDLYALGVILWECCTGRRLWQAESVTQLVAAQLGTTPPTLHFELGGQTPPALSELIAQLLSAAPNKRPDTAGSVRDTLRRLALTQTAPPGATDLAAHSHERGLAGLAGTTSRWTPVLTRWHALRARRGALPAIAGVLALLLTGSLLWTGDDDPGPGPGEPVARPGDAHVNHVMPPVSAAEPPVPPPTLPPTPVAPAPLAVATDQGGLPADEPPLPITLAQSLATLLGSDDKRARKRAAEQILAHQPKQAVPVYLLNLAWLEKANSCENKRAVLDKMDAAGDPRVLPALHRLANTRRRGCGFFSAKDCLGCLRESLARTIGRLGAEAPPPAPP